MNIQPVKERGLIEPQALFLAAPTCLPDCCHCIQVGVHMANFDPLSPFFASDRLALVCKWVFCPRRPRDRCHWLWGREGGREEEERYQRESGRARESVRVVEAVEPVRLPPHAKCPYQARLKTGFLSALKHGVS